MANRVQLAGITLHYCRYDAPTRIEFANMAGYRQFFCLSGVGALRSRGQCVDLDPGASVVIPPDSDFVASYGENYSHLVVQFDEPHLLRQAGLLQGEAPPGRLALPAPQAIGGRELRRLKAVALALAAQFSEGPEPNRIVIAELEQALTTAFLFENEKNFSKLRSDRPGRAGVGEVKRLEDYINANWDRALTIDDLAREGDMSVRSLTSGFKREIGVTPAEYIRRVRGETPRRALGGRDGGAAPPGFPPAPTGEPEPVALRLARLSRREREVLNGMVAGLSNKVMAGEMGLSARTVELHRANLMKKMQAKNLSDLLRMVLTS